MSYAAFAKKFIPRAKLKTETDGPVIYKFNWPYCPDGFCYGIFKRRISKSQYTQIFATWIYDGHVDLNGYMHENSVQLHKGPLPQWARDVLESKGLMVGATGIEPVTPPV
jgi:hypothetical protein